MDQNSRDRDEYGERQQTRQEPLMPEVIDPGARKEIPSWGTGSPFGEGDSLGGRLFGPRSFRGGQVQVYGCSPGCLILSIALSVIASILLTLLLNAIL